jgi:hypothetical protein
MRQIQKPHPKDQRFWPGYRTAISKHLARKQGIMVIKLRPVKIEAEDLLGLPKILP